MGRLEKIAVVLFLIAILNFALFWVISFSIGGDAISGKVADGRYYVASHSKFTEVPKWVWHYSRIHTISVFVTHLLGLFVGGGLFEYSRRKKKAG